MRWYQNIFNPRYVSEDALANLRLYKYGAVDRSYLSYYVLRHYWNWAAEWFPSWMAPNLITLMGLGFPVLNLICMLVLTPDLVGPGAPWLYYSCSLGLWLYSTFDNVDGKQARKTGTSSPLGELFDHGCDALNCSIGALVQAGAMGVGHTMYAAFLLLLTMLPFYLSTWEEYHTGVLYLGFMNGPTEGLVIACICMALSGYYGPHIWTDDLRQLFGEKLVPSYVPQGFTIFHGMMLMMTVLMIFFHIPASLYNVYQACKSKNKPFLPATAQLIPITILSLAGYLWLASPHSYILAHQHFSLFALAVGIVFGRVATKIILAHVTKQPFPMFTVLILPLIGGCVLTNLPLWLDVEPLLTARGEYWYLVGYLIFAAVAYAHWALLVIDRFCKYLGISCLTIPHTKITKTQ
ncbi:uncharacterized protein VTP21DRAFT_5764 [Calcarisporiella thermophila]|uniref:uncharacterized protein n=1 Tax=Calcarisporiella thermophila TaxID=911321 RepID=UPI0037440E14